MDMKKTIIFYLFFWALPAQAATIFLRDGGRLDGTIVSSTSQEVQISTSQGVQTVPTSRISRIDYETPAAQPAAPQAPPSPPARVQPPPPSQVPSATPPPPSGVPPTLPYEYQLEAPRALSRGMSILSFDLGVDIPLNDIDLSQIPSGVGGSDRNGDIGPLVGVQYLYQLGPRLGVGAAFEFLHRSATDSQTLLQLADTEASGNSLLFLGVARYMLRERGTVRPYILAGLGAHRTSTLVEATPQIGFTWFGTNTAETRTLIDSSAWGFAAMARLGLDFYTGSMSTLGLEAGWARVDRRTYAATSAGANLPGGGLGGVTNSINFFTIAGRFGFIL